MTTANPASKSRTWLILSFLILAAGFIFFFRTRSDNVQDLLRQQGMPAARQGIALSQEGKKLLPLEEQQEMDAIYRDALNTLSPQEQQRFITLAQKGTAATDNEIAESAELLQKALGALPQEKKARLWELVEKSVKLAQQKASAATKPQ